MLYTSYAAGLVDELSKAEKEKLGLKRSITEGRGRCLLIQLGFACVFVGLVFLNSFSALCIMVSRFFWQI